MTDYLVTEFLDSVDFIISSPIQQTQRIKYTACDVSENYLIFGASSGGLYIFNRQPCSFIKLIPSSEGAVANLSISPNEKLIAVATSKGTLCLFNNDDSVSRNVLIFTEHQDNVITAMKWHSSGNDLYSGDNTGKISVVVTNFISKAVFQIPCATLMQLDSCVVEIDLSSHFLLVSTLTRCYLCDTETEHYRQIGKKLRDGEYGACFFGSKFEYTHSSERKIELGNFSILNDKDSFITYSGLEHLKIFCARPGARLWEVELNGVVVRTHQFKNVLSKESNRVILLPVNSDGRMNFKTKSNSDAHNFMKMHTINNFILTYHKNGIYILDPHNVKVIFWTDIYTDIINIKIVKNIIYIWTSKNQMHILLFTTLEDLIIKCLCNKMYTFCADLCIFYENQIKKILPQPNKLYLISVLNEKLLEIDAIDLHQKLQPLFSLIKKSTPDRQIATKLSNGIFVIDNTHLFSSLPETQETNDSETVLDDSVSRYNNLLCEEYELSKINKNYKTNILNMLFDSCTCVKDITDAFSRFEMHFGETGETNINMWGYETCLRYINEHLDKYILRDIESNDYITNAFLKINTGHENVCDCMFPLPKASLIEPKFYNIGQILIRYYFSTDNYLCFCKQVPYMWRDILKLRENEDVINLVPLILQFGDAAMLSYFQNKFTHDLWNEIINKYIFLKKSKCLNCEKQFADANNYGFSWNVLATEMIKTIGAESSVRLLLQYAENIPKTELNNDFYQCCIYSTVMDNFDPKLRLKAVEFLKDLSSANINFGNLLEKTLQHREFSNINCSIVAVNDSCSYCLMPLNTPVICKEKIVELNCGHYFHNICYKKCSCLCKICSE